MRMSPQLQQIAQKQLIARVKSVQILDWPYHFRRGEPDIYLVATVIDDNNNTPFTLKLDSFPKIRQDELLPIDSQFGVQMYRTAGHIPAYLDIRILVARSKEGIRQAGEAMTSIESNPTFKSAIATLSTMVAGPIGVLASQADRIIGIIGAILKLQKDSKLCYYVATISRDFDNLAVGQQIEYKNRYVSLSYKIEAGTSKEIVI